MPKTLAIIFGIVALVLVVGYGIPLTEIALRLRWNGAVAKELVEGLEARFPKARFQGGASYEKEVVYIDVISGIDEPDRPTVVQWLRDEKIKRNIRPEVWIRFDQHGDESHIKL